MELIAWILFAGFAVVLVGFEIMTALLKRAHAREASLHKMIDYYQNEESAPPVPGQE